MAKNLTKAQPAAPPLQMVSASAAGAAPAFNLKPCPFFYLTHHPSSWEVGEVDGKRYWLPRLKRLKLAPGVNAVRQGRKGGPPDASLAIAQAQRQGKTIIPDTFDGGYVHKVRGARGWVHLLKFDTPKNLGRTTVIKTDHEAYRAFRLKLVTSGLIAPPEPEILEAIMDRQRNRSERRADQAHIPREAKRIEREEAKLTEMREAVAHG